MSRKKVRPGRHAAATAAGAAGAGAAGALTGASVAGPAGAAVGGVIGAAVGAVAGNSFASEFDATEEERYWREHFARRPYRRAGRDFAYYEPAYRFGWENARHPRNESRSFEDAEPELAERWLEWMVGDASPEREWHEIRDAVRDAWRRIRGDD